MAMTKCRECSKDISTTATACPHCGAKPKPKTSGCAWLAAIFIAVPVVLSMFASNQRSNEIAASAEVARVAAAEAKTREAAALAAMTPEQKAAAQTAAAERQVAAEKAAAESAALAQEQSLIASGVRWRYSESADDMGRGTVRNAVVRSVNSEEFEFPYRGAQRGALQIRKHPVHGTDVIFFIERGQFMCEVYHCNLNVRYDERPPVEVHAAKPADMKTTMVFLPNAKSLIRELHRSKKLRIEANYYNNGSRVFEFDVSGLEWKTN